MEDFTDRVIEFLKERFPGYEVHQPLTTFINNTTERLGVKFGDEIKARGSVRVGDFDRHEGTLKRIQVQSHTFWFTEPYLKISFHYTSKTSAERWLWPGGLIVDHPWGNSQPEGILSGTLHMVPQEGAVLHLGATAKGGHDDRPNNFIADRVAPQTLGKLDALLEEFTGISIRT